MTTVDLINREYGEYYKRYIDKVDPALDLRNGFQAEGVLTQFFNSIPDSKLDFRYADGKWSIKEVFQHIIDTERVFAHRMFRIGRMDNTPLPGFDQDIYINPSGADQKTLEKLQGEYASTRANTRSILNSFSEDHLINVGEASGFPLSPRAAAFIILGHEIWHKDILAERYLS